MSLHDLFTQAGRDRARRRFRLRLVRRGLGLPGLSRRGLGLSRREPGCSARATARRRRRLAAIDRALARETPWLASMFVMFNELAAEEPVRAERLPSRTWRRPRPAQVAFLATLAAIAALCVVLSTQVHSVMRPCMSSASEASAASPFASASSPPSASTSAPSSALSSAPPAGGMSGLAAFVPVRGLTCRAYAAPNK